MRKKTHPYQNRSLKNIKRERWVAIKGYEEYYQVSDFGRVKALEKQTEFMIPGRHLVSYWRPEKILSQGLAKRWNSVSREYIYRLTVTLCVDQIMKTTALSRLVWDAFAEELDFKKDQLFISFKDGTAATPLAKIYMRATSPALPARRIKEKGWSTCRLI